MFGICGRASSYAVKLGGTAVPSSSVDCGDIGGAGIHIGRI
jgi:hypothetical protein